MTIVRDPLLAAMRGLLLFFIFVIGLFAAALALCAPLVAIFQDKVIAEFVSGGVKDAAAIYPALPFVLLGLAALVASGVYFLVLLKRIVASVGQGDPFVPVNATRLGRMGWTLLAAQVAAVPIGAAVVWIAGIVDDDKGANVHVGDDFGFSGGGILLTLVLFILARVFRRGAEMREELEGTV